MVTRCCPLCSSSSSSAGWIRQRKESFSRSVTQSPLLDCLFSLLSENNSERVTLHSEENPHACGPGWGKHDRNQNCPTEDSLTSNSSFCHPRCCNQPRTRGCSLSALMKHQQKDNISAASPFPPISGRQVQPQERLTKWVQMWQICKFTGSYPEKLAAAKNVLFGTPLHVFCVYTNGFTSFSSSRERIRRTSKKY